MNEWLINNISNVPIEELSSYQQEMLSGQIVILILVSLLAAFK